MELFNDQSYKSIVKKYAGSGVPWTDPTFPPNNSSIGLSKAKSLPGEVTWKRPYELGKSPKLFVDGISSKDTTQGRMGNCWVVAACSVLAGCKEMWTRVIPNWESQVCDPEEQGYAGVFRFRFWRFGKWVEVLVDDLLPTQRGIDAGKDDLLFAHSSNQLEYWGSLLEKAYAKLHGNYALLDGGNLSDALVDFTGGISEVIDIEAKSALFQSDPDAKKQLFQMMASEMEDCALMCAAIRVGNAEEMEQRTDLGLVKGHAYGITAVKKIPLGDLSLISIFRGREKLSLIRLQNPWGQKEWSGPFSDGSPEWSSISEKEREKLGLTFRDDGEFWMPFDDFVANFTEVSICRLINTSKFTFSKTWKEARFFGAWGIRTSSTRNGDNKTQENRAGGCLNHQDTFLDNPQYRFDVPQVDDSSEELEVIIQLSQKDAKATILKDKKESLVIGFHIMQVEANRKYRVHRILPASSLATSDYIKTNHVFLRKKLPRKGGRFVIVPTTFHPGQSTEYLLRMFTEQDANVTELVEDFPVLRWYQKCFIKPYSKATHITVLGASGLKSPGTFGSCDPYCYIRCEREKVKSPVVENSLNPQWDFSVVFYRSQHTKPISIQIWNRNLVVDTFLGEALVGDAASDPEATDARALGSILKVRLAGRKGKTGEVVEGDLKLRIQSFNDLEKA